MKRLPLFLSFLLFLGVCMSGTYWTMQFIKPQNRQVAPLKSAERNDVSPEAVMNLFGGHLSVAAASNFQLKGVVVAKNEKESVAILAADGKPAEAVRVDTEVIPGVVVREVHKDYVMLSENGVMKRVELPASAPVGGGVPTFVPMPPPPPMPQPAQVVQPVQAMQPPQPGQPAQETGQQQVQPPQMPPMPDGPQGRIGRSAARIRNNLNNPPQQ
ncbi:MAG TPA: type II secretion system protein N [Burkholderiaceae bacterium]